MKDMIVAAWERSMLEAPMTFERAREVATREVRAEMPDVSDEDALFRGRVMRRTMQLTHFVRSKVDMTGLAEAIRAARQRITTDTPPAAA